MDLIKTNIKSATASFDHLLGLDDTPFSLGFGFGRVDVDIAYSSGPGYPESGSLEYEWLSDVRYYSIGFRYSGEFDFAIGLTYKDFAEHMAMRQGWDGPGFESESRNELDDHAFDFGVLFRMRTMGPRLTEELPARAHWRSDVTFGFALNNLRSSESLWYGYSNGLPKAARFGTSVTLTCAQPHIDWLTLRPAVELEVALTSSGYVRYGYEWDSYYVRYHQNTVRFGGEATVAELFSFRLGRVWTPAGQDHFGTYGVTVDTQGLRKLLECDQTKLRPNVRFSVAHIPCWEETHYAIEIVL